MEIHRIFLNLGELTFPQLPGCSYVHIPVIILVIMHSGPMHRADGQVQVRYKFTEQRLTTRNLNADQSTVANGIRTAYFGRFSALQHGEIRLMKYRLVARGVQVHFHGEFVFGMDFTSLWEMGACAAFCTR